MALNASLVLSGDGEGAERALRGVNEELERGQQGAEAYNLAYAKTDASIKKLATAQGDGRDHGRLQGGRDLARNLQPGIAGDENGAGPG